MKIIIAFVLLQALCVSFANAGELAPVTGGAQPELSLTDVKGQQVSLDQFRGRIVLVNFWASWCTPCIREMPSLLRLQDSFSDLPFSVLGVNVQEPERRVKLAIKRLRLDFPVLLDRDGDVFRTWAGVVLPTTFVVDAEGKTRYVVQGPIDWDRTDVQDVLRNIMR